MKTNWLMTVPVIIFIAFVVLGGLIPMSERAGAGMLFGLILLPILGLSFIIGLILEFVKKKPPTN